MQYLDRASQWASQRVDRLFEGEGVHHRAEDTGNSERPPTSSTMAHNQKDLFLNSDRKSSRAIGANLFDGVKTAALESSTTTT